MIKITHPAALLKTILLLCALLYMGVCGYLWAMQKELIFNPSKQLQTSPDRLGLAFESVKIPVGTGDERGELDAWWIPAAHNSDITLLYLHGNDHNVSSNASHAQRLHDMGYNVLLADYRGYGNSTGGAPSEAKVYEDAEAVWDYLRSSRGLKPAQIFIYGHSLGGAIAIDLATHHADAAGMIVESTFTSMQAMGELRYSFLPVAWMVNQRFDSLQKIPQLKIPLLLIHGTWDKEVPVAMSQQLFAAARSAKTLTLINGGGHNNSGAVGWLEYRDALNKFIEQPQRAAAHGNFK
ncbi:MAG: alpha/beta hydrolase [Gallionella sp.]